MRFPKINRPSITLPKLSTKEVTIRVPVVPVKLPKLPRVRVVIEK